MDTKSYKVDIKASRTVDALSLELNVYRERRKLTSIAKKVESDFEAVLLTNEKHRLNRGVLWATPKEAMQVAPKTIEQRLVLARDLTDLSSTFSNLSSLEYVDLSDWDTSRVTNFDSMFNHCDNLKRIDGVIDLSSIDKVFIPYKSNPLGNMFYSCKALEKKIVIKNPPSDYLDIEDGKTKWEKHTQLSLDKFEFIFG